MDDVITEKEVLANLSANLRRILANKPMSQPRLAATTGIPVATIYRMVNGSHTANIAHVAIVAEVLDTSIDKLVAPPPAIPLASNLEVIEENSSVPA